MKIKITEAGWAGYTGFLGHVEFVDGVSVDSVNSADAGFLAGIVGIEREDGSNPSDTQRLIDLAGMSAPVEMALAAGAAAGGEGSAAPVAAPKVYTFEELAAIGDQGGINAIRAIAEPLGLKDNSIADLIKKVLAHQEANKPAEAPAADAAAADAPAA